MINNMDYNLNNIMGNNNLNINNNMNNNNINQQKELELKKKIDELNQNLTKISKEIKEIKDNKSKVQSELESGENIISILIVSLDQKVTFPVSCKKTDIFNSIELKCYEKYPEYKETDNFFMTKGYKINRNKTIEENNIKDGDTIILSNLVD